MTYPAFHREIKSGGELHIAAETVLESIEQFEKDRNPDQVYAWGKFAAQMAMDAEIEIARLRAAVRILESKDRNAEAIAVIREAITTIERAEET